MKTVYPTLYVKVTDDQSVEDALEELTTWVHSFVYDYDTPVYPRNLIKRNADRKPLIRKFLKCAKLMPSEVLFLLEHLYITEAEGEYYLTGSVTSVNEDVLLSTLRLLYSMDGGEFPVWEARVRDKNLLDTVIYRLTPSGVYS